MGTHRLTRHKLSGSSVDKRDKNGLLIHAIYADDFPHFTNYKAMYQDFQKQFKKRFEVKTGSVGVYLGNQIKVDDAKLTV